MKKRQIPFLQLNSILHLDIRKTTVVPIEKLICLQETSIIKLFSQKRKVQQMECFSSDLQSVLDFINSNAKK